MAQIGEECCFALWGAAPLDLTQNFLAQRRYSFAGQGGSLNFRRGRLRRLRLCGHKVRFVPDDNRSSFRRLSNQRIVFSGERLRRIQNDQYDVGVGKGFFGFPNADGFGLVFGLANTGRVHHPQRDSADGNGFGDQVTRSAGSSGDDGPFTFDKAIEETGLADVGTTDDGERQAFVHDFAVGKGSGEKFERRSDFGKVRMNRGCRQDRDVIIGKIDAGFQKRDQLYQPLFDGLKSVRESAAELLRSHLRLLQGLRIDEITNCLRLCQVDASVEEGAHSELTWLGETSTTGECEFDDMPQNDGGAVG